MSLAVVLPRLLRQLDLGRRVVPEHGDDPPAVAVVVELDAVDARRMTSPPGVRLPS
jgi:hypothetical protein